MRRLIEKLNRVAARLLWGPRIRVESVNKMVRLGTTYGGWVYLDSECLNDSVLISCGLGEDASFDVEFARKYGAKVLLVDPTPRAIEHFSSIMSRLGKPSSSAYVEGGQQPPSAYDLSNISVGQFSLERVAVSDQRGSARFFAPPNSADVSYSLINFQGNYATDTPYIEVDTLPVEALFEDFLDRDVLLKLDIEGAEIRALARLADSDVRPVQILVEFDELSRPSRRARKNFKVTHRLLSDIGYIPIYFDKRTCVSYVRQDQIPSAP